MASPILNGYVQFADNKGNALAGGSVAYYHPGTTTPKPVWKDRTMTTPATNPAPIDNTGRAQFYGSGIYRQVVREANNQLVWDGEVTCVSEDLFPLATGIAALDLASDLTSLTTSGFAVAGKGGARYLRLTTPPPASEIAAGSSRWLFQSNNGAVWWRLAEIEPTDLMFGVMADAVAGYAGGTMTVTGTDDTAALQAAINFIVYFNTGSKVLRLPSGRRRITDTLHAGYGDKLVDWAIEGDRRRAWDVQQGYHTGIFALFNDRPAFNIQGARRATIRNLAVIGPNHGWLTANYNGIADRTQRASWRGPQARNDNTDQFAPSCAIAVDGYTGVRQTGSHYPDVVYPSWTGLVTQYSKGASSQMLFEGLTCGGFQVGVAVQPNLVPAASNGDFIRWIGCDLSWNEVAVSVSHSDARSVAFERSLLHFCHTAFDSLTFGSSEGNICASFDDCSFDNCYQVFNVNLGITQQKFAPSIIVNNGYCEATYKLGIVRTTDAPDSVPGSIRFNGGELSFFCKPGETSPETYLDGLGEVSAAFDGTCFRGTYGYLPINCEMADTRFSMPTIAHSVFDIPTPGGQRAMTALGGIFAPRFTGQSAIRAFYGFGYNGAAKFDLLVESHGWNMMPGPDFVRGLPIPLHVRTAGSSGYELPVGQAPQQVLDRAAVPLTGLTKSGIEWSFTCSLGFLNDASRPAYCLGAGDIVRDEASGLMFYIKSATFSGSGPTGTVAFVLRQINRVFTADGSVWTTDAALDPASGKLRFYCSRRLVAGKTKRLLLQTTAGSATALLLCPGSEAGADGQLNTIFAPMLQPGDYLLASTADSHTPEQSLFPAARIVSIDLVSGQVVFDTSARRSATVASPLFVKAV